MSTHKKPRRHEELRSPSQKWMKHCQFVFFNEKGSTLIQVLIAAGLMSILALGFSSIISQQHKQIKVLEQKSETLDIKNEILIALSKQDICACNLNPSKLAPVGTRAAIEFSTSPATFNLTDGLRTQCDGAYPKFLSTDKKTMTSLTVDRITIEELTQIDATSNQWTGRMEVAFGGGNMALKNISFPINVRTTSTTAPFQVDVCSVSAMGSDDGLITFDNVMIVNGPTINRGYSTAYCPAGYIVISGGSNFVSSVCDERHRFVARSRPLADKSGWSAFMECSRAYTTAVCVKAK